MAEVDNRNFVQVKVYIPAELYRQVSTWLEGDGSEEMMDWGEFIEMAWATVPWIYSAYMEYMKGFNETPELKRKPEPMSLDDFAQHSVYEWFK